MLVMVVVMRLMRGGPGPGGGWEGARGARPPGLPGPPFGSGPPPGPRAPLLTELIVKTFEKHTIPLSQCRGQGYDNGSNMKGKYEGAQAHILQKNELALFSPCGCHSLNLCGVHAAESCPAVITFFGTIQKLFNIFSASPQRWDILQKHIGCSLHSMSQTRW